MLSFTQRTSLPHLPELIDELPNISGWEADVRSVVQHNNPIFLPKTNIRLEEVSAAFAIALHMHQPMIPAGSEGELISNLQYMFEHPYEDGNHNAGPFLYCYSRIADFVPELISQGCNPRIMLDYSGTLLWGLRHMGRGEVLENLKRVTCDPAYQPYVEWLGTLWGHAVVSSIPIADIKLHIQAWQHHFAAVFGWEALARVRGFSLPEMHLPNHPDVLFTLVHALKESGYRWLLVQEHTVETLSGQPISDPHLPHRLVARNSKGETTSITVLIKTQAANSHLVAQMQPYSEAKTLGRQSLGAIAVPPLVTQIADGENSGVMMNEFPSCFRNAWYEMKLQSERASKVVGLTGTEYLELIEAAGCRPEDYPTCQAIAQHYIWQQVTSEPCSSALVEQAIQQIKQSQSDFHVNGASGANGSETVPSSESVVAFTHQLSTAFHRKLSLSRSMTASTMKRSQATNSDEHTRQPYYRSALLYNLLVQTSCFRTWGQGTWTHYAHKLFQQGEALLRRQP